MKPGSQLLARVARTLGLGFALLACGCQYKLSPLPIVPCVGEPCADRASDADPADGSTARGDSGGPGDRIPPPDGRFPGDPRTHTDFFVLDWDFGDPQLAGDDAACGACGTAGAIYCGGNCNYCCAGTLCDLSAECR
jgi:hypothetical protein